MAGRQVGGQADGVRANWQAGRQKGTWVPPPQLLLPPQLAPLPASTSPPTPSLAHRLCHLALAAVARHHRHLSRVHLNCRPGRARQKEGQAWAG